MAQAGRRARALDPLPRRRRTRTVAVVESMTEESRSPCEPEVHGTSPLHSLDALLRRQLYVSLAMVALSLPLGAKSALAVGLGAVISLANLRLLVRSVVRMLQPGSPSGGLILRLFLHLRLVALFAIVALVLVRTELPPIEFTAGLSSVVPAALWHGWCCREL